jgi:hypothetical protein
MLARPRSLRGCEGKNWTACPLACTPASVRPATCSMLRAQTLYAHRLCQGLASLCDHNAFPAGCCNLPRVDVALSYGIETICVGENTDDAHFITRAGRGGLRTRSRSEVVLSCRRVASARASTPCTVRSSRLRPFCSW